MDPGPELGAAAASNPDPPTRAARICDLAAGTIALFVLVELASGGSLPGVAAFQQLAHVVLLGCLPLALVAARLGRRRAAWALAACSVMWVPCFGGRLSLLTRPARTAGTAEPPALRVLTFNLGSHRSDPADVVPFLRACGADLVALQEVSERHALAFERELADVYPHRALHGLGIPGLGLLSRRPLLEEELLWLASETRPHQRAVVLVDGRRVRVLNVHPSAWVALLGRHSTGGEDLARIAALAAGPGPTLVLGDFNSTDRSDQHGLFRAVPLIDSYLEAGTGLGFTFPEFLRYRGVPLPPFARLDYVWHSRDLSATRARVLPGGLGSDHLPLEVALAWRAPGAEEGKRPPP